ncbi:MAG: extracellular solute-binding protein [Janthinobacterium lividum]
MRRALAAGTMAIRPGAALRGVRARRVARMLGVIVIAAALPLSALAVPAIAQYGEPKYAPGFTHFDYVNPNAPQGGTLVLANPDRQTSFDKFNPFTLRGNPAPGIAMMFESLTLGSADEPASAYGLLADDIAVAPDGLSVVFHLNPAARFSNGDAVTAADVKYSFDTLVSTQASPAYRLAWQDIARAVVIDSSHVRFDFKHVNRELPLIAGSVPVFSPKWGLRSDGSRIAFDALTTEMPIGSGPYLMDRPSGGSGVSYRKDPHYWGRDLPVRRGTYNFAHIVYKLYGDDTARLEAFKAGEFDAVVEYRARSWVRSYIGRRFTDGEVLKGTFLNRNAAGMQGFFMNTRRPLMRDPRVRQALSLALDFEWLNRQLFYGQYQRLDSFFANSDLAARGLPGADELALLEPLRAQLDPAVFGPMVTQPLTEPAPHSLRANLRQARALLTQAGWNYRDGALRDARGTPFEFDILDDTGGSIAQVATPYLRNLALLGIHARFITTDFALYQQRLNDFDFDMTTVRYPGAQIPGNELSAAFGSAAAATPGSDNVAGVASSAVDTLINAVLRAGTLPELRAASRALDRVLMHGYYVVPHWYSNQHRIAYRRTLAHPATLPLFYMAEDWIVADWWDTRAAPAIAASVPAAVTTPAAVAATPAHAAR